MSNDPSILFVKPRAISARDKKALSTVGVVVVETEDPAAVKFVRAGFEIEGGLLLTAALDSIRNASFSSVREAFATRMCAAIISSQQKKGAS